MDVLLAILILTAQSDTLHAELRRVLTVSVRIDVHEGRYLSITTDSVPADDPAAPLVNRHRRIFNYLLTNSVPALQLFSGVDPRASEAARTHRFIENFLADATASSAMAAYYRALLPTQPPAAPDSERATILERQVLTIASRFFYPARIVGNTVQVYRCTGINGVADLGSARNLVVEAFAFATIFEADSATPLNRDFEAARLRVQQYARAAPDSGAALERARASMYEAMMRSAGLGSVLRNAYGLWGGRLPFRVPQWQQ